jgi:hypothetical protein
LCIFFVGNQAPLHGQQQFYREKWIGLHNMAFKDKTETSEYQTPSWFANSTTNEKRFSIGFHYRWFPKERTYHQLDLFARDREEDDKVSLLYSLSSGNFLGALGATEQRSTIRLGYRIGRMFPIAKRLTADVSLGAHPSYQRMETVPNGSFAFPRMRTAWGAEARLYAGLNYRIHKRINIAYHFVPMTMSYYHSKNILKNPLLTRRQQESTSKDYDVNFLGDLLDVRNITISYVPKVTKKKKKRKKRRRRR